MGDDELVDELARRLTQAEREIERLTLENRKLLKSLRATSAGRLFLWMQECARGAQTITLHLDTMAAAMELKPSTMLTLIAELRDVELIQPTRLPNGFYRIQFCKTI